MDFPSPPSAESPRYGGKTPTEAGGFARLRASHLTLAHPSRGLLPPVLCHRRAVVLQAHPSLRNEREGKVLGEQTPKTKTPKKIQAVHELSPGYELTSSLLAAGISGDISVCLQQPPCPSQPRFLFLCCLKTRKKIGDRGPQRASLLLATEVNDLNPATSAICSSATHVSPQPSAAKLKCSPAP